MGKDFVSFISSKEYPLGFLSSFPCVVDSYYAAWL